MGVVVDFHARASAGSDAVAKNSSSGRPVARLKRAASENDGDRHPVSMRETVAGVVPAASATSLSDSSLALRWARSGCIPFSLPRWKGAGQAKVSMADKDVAMSETYAVPMVARIRPKKPRQRAYLREHREKLEWSQDHLASLLNTTAATISRYENGKRDYPGGFLAAAAEAFGKSEAEMYRLPDESGTGARSLDLMLRDAPPAIRELAYAAARAVLDTHSRQEPIDRPKQALKK